METEMGEDVRPKTMMHQYPMITISVRMANTWMAINAQIVQKAVRSATWMAQ